MLATAPSRKFQGQYLNNDVIENNARGICESVWDSLTPYYGRHYDPSIGQFLTEDPIGFEAGDTNLIRYVGNDPVNHTDPTGMVENPTNNEERYIGFIYIMENPAIPNGVYVGKAEFIPERLTPEHKHSELLLHPDTKITLKPVFANVDPSKLTRQDQTRILLECEQREIDARGGVIADNNRNIKNELNDPEKRKEVTDKFKPVIKNGGVVKAKRVEGKTGKGSVKFRKGAARTSALAGVAASAGAIFLPELLGPDTAMGEFLDRLGERGVYGVYDPLWDEKLELEAKCPSLSRVLDGATGSGRIIKPMP